MSILIPGGVTAGDICNAALAEALVVGENQSASQDQINKALARLQFLIIEWQRSRQLVYHLQDFSIVCTGATSYTIGPGGQIDTGAGLDQFNYQFNYQFGSPQSLSARPASIQSAFIRQPQGTGNGALPIDYPLEIIKAKEDYNKIAFKNLSTLSQYLFYDSAWPLGVLYPYPVPTANIYELHVSIMQILPPAFASTSGLVNLPFEYYNALVLNLAVRLRSLYGVPTYQGDALPGLARDALAVIRGANLQIARLSMPVGLVSRGKGYNIFSDQFG